MAQWFPDNPADERKAVLPRPRIRRGGGLLTVLLVLSLAGCRAATPEEEDLALHGRAALALDGGWQVWLDPAAIGLREDWPADLAAGRRPAAASADPIELPVPGPLEASAATRTYDGVAFYVRDFRAPSRLRGCRLRLQFVQVNYACRAWLDGQSVGEHEGGYDAFDFDVTGRLEEPGLHRLVVMVIDPGAAPVLGLTLKTTPHSKESWYENAGGLLGPVTLLCDRGPVATSLAVRADAATSTLAVRGSLLAPPREADAEPRALRVAVSVYDATTPAGATLTAKSAAAPAGVQAPLARGEVELPVGADGRAELSLELAVPGARRWSPESPQLYRVVAEADGRAVGERSVGFRSVEIAGGNLLINGERRVLAGVLWQPHFTGTGGVVPSDAELEHEVRDILATGFNLVRAHVRPAPPAFLDAADRLGLLVLEEPAIGWVDDDPALLPRLRHELDWMVERDAHHPSIILWGVLNELSGKAYRYAGELAGHLAALDRSLPVLEDSGGFIGDGRFVPPAGAAPAGGGAPVAPVASQPMLDRHLYPAWPLPLAARDEMAGLGAPGQLVFVSEYGYGTLPDTQAAIAGFRERAILDEERIKFESMAATARRAAASGEGWRTGTWLAEARVAQADAAEDMTEALRSNPALDLFCYTQWRAVSSECSSGLLEPWGQERPARQRLRHALRPLLATVLPERTSVFAGEPIRGRVALVNDAGAPVRARALLHWSVEDAAGVPARSGDLPLGGDETVPPGVTHREIVLPPAATQAAGRVVLTAQLLDGARVLEESTPRAVAVVAEPAPLALGWIALPGGFAGPGRAVAWPAVWAPPGDDAARDFLRRRGQEAPVGSPGSACVALIGHPEQLDAQMSLREQVELWSMVRRGGAAIVLLPDPADDDMARRLGQRGGMLTLTALPLPIAVGAAAGNFMGRLQLFRGWPAGSVDPPRALGRDDTAFSPRAMVLGELPAGWIESQVTLGTLGNRLGAPLVELPYGRGTIALVGWPLLDPVEGAIDPQREALLAERVGAAVAAARDRLGGAAPEELQPWPDALTAELQHGVEIIDRLVALGDRSAAFLGQGLTAQGRLPEKVSALPGARAAALQSLLDDRPMAARESLLATIGPLWTEDTQQVVALEADVLQRLGARVAAAGRDNWDAAYDAVEQWARGVAAWFGGDTPLALDWLGRARQTLDGGPAGVAGAPGA